MLYKHIDACRTGTIDLGAAVCTHSSSSAAGLQHVAAKFVYGIFAAASGSDERLLKAHATPLMGWSTDFMLLHNLE